MTDDRDQFVKTMDICLPGPNPKGTVNAKRASRAPLSRARQCAAVATLKAVWRCKIQRRLGSWHIPTLKSRAGITCNDSSVCQRNRCQIVAGRLAFKLKPQPFEPRHNAPGPREALPERSARSAAGALLAAPTGKNGMNGDTEEEEEEDSCEQVDRIFSEQGLPEYPKWEAELVPWNCQVNLHSGLCCVVSN